MSRTGRHLAVAGLLILIAIPAVLLGLDWCYPLAAQRGGHATLVTARDGTPLRAFADENGVWRYPAAPEDVSPLYLQALIGYEDRWFYRHPGVNPMAFTRACLQNLKAGRVISGGSTLTMQAARLLHPVPRTFPGKIRQILRAFQLEWHLTKEQILTLYLNHAPFGANIEGVRAASRTYLGKPASQLSHAEAALLAVLPQAPSRYRPDRHPQRARKARDKLLDRMVRFGIWEQRTVSEARQEPVTALRVTAPVQAPLACRRLFSAMKGTARIATFLDADLQSHLSQVVKDYVCDLSPDQSAALMVVNHQSLEILAYAGSADFYATKRKGHVDMVRAIRSPGSALKPFLYGLALDQGLIHSHSLLLDTPRVGQDYDPGNFTNGFSGPVSAARALRLSLNLPAVQLLEAYGPKKFHDRLNHAGAGLVLTGKPNLSIILGGAGTSLEKLVRLYTALARQGMTGKPRLAKEAPVKNRHLMSEGAAWIVRQMLLSPMPGFEGVNRLAGHTPMAWKTGTSYGFRDSWAFGIMGDYVAGVWVGRPDGSPSPGQYGAVTALPLLRQVFESLPLSDFRTPMPVSVRQTTICWPLGTEKQSVWEDCHVRHRAWILDDAVPLTLPADPALPESLKKTFWIDARGLRARPSCGGETRVTVTVWPQAAEAWIPGAWRRHDRIPRAAPGCSDMSDGSHGRLLITSIHDGSRITAPPGQARVPAIELSARGGKGPLYWFLNGRAAVVSRPGLSAHLPMPGPGEYQLTVADAHGHTDRVVFQVVGAP